MSILSAFLGGMIIFIAVYALIYYSRTDNKIHENEVRISKLEEKIVSMEREIKFVRELFEKDNSHLQDTIKADVLGKSIRATNNKLKYLFLENTDNENPFAVKIYDGRVYKNFYRKDKVLEFVNKPRATKYRRTCVQCKRKFFSKQGENVCPNCMVEPVNSKTYDPVACKALLLVLTNKKWWDIATSIVDDSDAFNTIIKTLIVSWTIGISLLLGGCLWL